MPAGPSPPPGRAETTTWGQPAKRVAANVAARRFCILASAAARPSAGIRSDLFNATISLSVVSSPMTRHSAVCVWMPARRVSAHVAAQRACRQSTPFVASMTSTIMSTICAPPTMVRIRLACPGQSTSVTCRRGHLSAPARAAVRVERSTHTPVSHRTARPPAAQAAAR